ncbi:hypothetical protein Tco_0221692 [Tanacetum coccineum]
MTISFDVSTSSNAIRSPLDVYQNYPNSKGGKEFGKVLGGLSRHTSSPGMEHWDAVNQVFKYLKKTIPYGLEYSRDPSVLEGYSDASWITNQEDYQSLWHWLHATKKHNGYETYLAQNKYAKVIGNLMYAMTCTRPDIAYDVGRLSRHTSSSGKKHWDAVNRVFKYLKKTIDYGLEYNGDPSVLEGYTDASWITD